MNSRIHVREADLSDIKHRKDVLDLLSGYAMDIIGGGKDLSEEVKQRLIPELRQNPSSVILLAFEEQTAVGLSICFLGFSTFYAKRLLNIHDFVVTETHRGQGIAKLMLEKLEEIARSKDCCKLSLEVLEGNKRAQKVYHSFGFSAYQLDAKMGKALFWDKKLL
jgi:ribosomal protein S18 acetylase RimI-like enzyme